MHLYRRYHPLSHCDLKVIVFIQSEWKRGCAKGEMSLQQRVLWCESGLAVGFINTIYHPDS